MCTLISTKIRTFILLVLVMGFSSWAQEGLEEDNFVSNVFNYGVLINSQTTETVQKGSFEFRIQHRFGELDLKNFGNTVVQEFFGFDGSANIRFGLSYALSDRFQLGFGRTKIDKVIDLEGKYRLIRQREPGEGASFSASLYFNAGISTMDFPEVGPNEFFADFETPFEHRFAHRLSYNTQLLLSRKFGRALSLELNPTFIYKNLVPAGDNNLVFATTLGGKIKTGLTSAIIFEYAAKFNNRSDNYKNPISIGYEIGTAGHAFQFFISSTNQIIEQNLFFSEPLDYTEGQLLIGFNIKRTFFNGNN